MNAKDLIDLIPGGSAVKLFFTHITGQSVADYAHCQMTLEYCPGPSANLTTAKMTCENCCWNVFLKGLIEIFPSAGASGIQGALLAAIQGFASKGIAGVFTGPGALILTVLVAADLLAVFARLLVMYHAYGLAKDTHCRC